MARLMVTIALVLIFDYINGFRDGAQLYCHYSFHHSAYNLSGSGLGCYFNIVSGEFYLNTMLLPILLAEPLIKNLLYCQ
jgi:hypothetical protein